MKRIVKTGLVYLGGHPVQASLVYDDATSEDVSFEVASFRLASQALSDLRDGPATATLGEPIVGTISETAPRALKLTRSSDGTPEIIRVDDISSVEHASDDQEPAMRALVLCGSNGHYVRETPEAIVKALGWEIAGVES